MKLIMIFFLIGISLCPMKANAKETSAKYFSVNLDIGNHECIAPNDYFSETFTIENQTPYSIKVRESEVSNVEDSKLYSVLLAGWDDSNESDALCSLDELSTDWYLIEPGKSLKLNLNIYFPSNLGNEYQDAKLKARFTFECRIPENESLPIDSVNPSEHRTVFTVPATSDEACIYSPITLCIISASFTLLLFLSRKHKRENNTHG